MIIPVYTPVSKDCDYIGLNQYLEVLEDAKQIKRIAVPFDNTYKRYFVSVGGYDELNAGNHLLIEPSDPRYMNPVIFNNSQYILCSQYRPEFYEMKNCYPFVFHIRNYYDLMKCSYIPWKERKIRSSWTGTIRHKRIGTPNYNRDKYIGSTEIFDYRPAKSFNMTCKKFHSSQEYYQSLFNTRFGLALMGDTVVCQRDFECLACGTFAMYEHGINTIRGHDFVPNVHFVIIEDVKHMQDVMNELEKTPEEAEEIAGNGYDYWNNNCSPMGWWNNILKFAEEKGIQL